MNRAPREDSPEGPVVLDLRPTLATFWLLLLAQLGAWHGVVAPACYKGCR
jgi:hypothetical protein